MKILIALLVLLTFFDGIFSVSDSTDLRHILKALEFVDRYPSFLSCADIYLPNGRAKLRSNGRVIRFNCKSGYQLLGKQFSTCIRGRWNTPTPVCVAKGCRELRPPVNGMMRKVDREGAVYTFACEPGYLLVGSMGLFCNRLLWNSTIPTCIPEVTNANLSCDFQSPDLCGWRQETRRDNFDWSATTSKTPSGYWGTGPSYDHTLGVNRTGQYMYIEASSPRVENDSAILISPVFNQDGSVNSLNDVMCVQLWYHMYGLSTGALKIHLKQDGTSTQLWNASGNHGDQWLFAIAPADINITKPFQIAIEALRGTGYAGDIAIDDFSIEFGDNCTPENETEVMWTSTTSPDYAIEMSTSGSDDASTPATDDLSTVTVPTIKQTDESTSDLASLADSSTAFPPITINSLAGTTRVLTTTTQTLTTTNIAFTRPTLPMKTTLLTTNKPTITTQPTTASTTTTPKPVTTTAKLLTTTTKLATTTKPTTTTTKPSTATTQPITTTNELTTTIATTIKPITTAVKPTIATTKPTIATTKPSFATTKPTIATTKPTIATTKPTIATTKPTIATTKPIAVTTTVRQTITTIKSTTPALTTAKTIVPTTKKSITKGPVVITTTKPTPRTTKSSTTLRTTTRRTYPPTFKPITKPTSTKKPIFPVTKTSTKMYTKPTTIKTTKRPATTLTETWTTVDMGRKPVLPPWVYLRTTTTVDPNDLDNDLRPLAQTAHGSVGVPAAIGITVVTVVVLLIVLVFHVYRKYAKRQKDNLHEDSDVRFLKDGEMHVEFIDHDVLHPISFT